MKFISTIFKAIGELIQVLLFKWLVLLIKLIKVFIHKIIEFCRRRRLPRAERLEVDKRCVTINTPVYYKPDPLIYSQYFLMGKGLAVTWDNPDIRLKKNGAYVDSSQLESDVEYEIEARIWNNSFDAPAPDMPVRFSYLDFGIGLTPIFISETPVDLGVKGGPQCPVFATSKWKTPPAAGHYCLQVLLKWSDDDEPNNNLGQENTNVGIFHSPADFTFKVKNRKRITDTIRFEADTYTIPPLIDCDDKVEPQIFTRNHDPLANHRRNNYPVPEGWVVQISPEKINLLPNEEAEIKVSINPPPGLREKKDSTSMALMYRTSSWVESLY